MSDTEKRKLSQARVADLRAELEKRGLDKNGVKAVLVERLVSALSAEGLTSTDIDDYIVESGSHEATKKLPKRGSTPSKTKDEDELMVDLDNKSEVLDYGENDDLEANKEDNSRDTAENDRESEVNKKEGENMLAAEAVEAVPEEDEFQVLDEEASDMEDNDNKEGQQQDGNVDNEDSIHLTLNEDDEKLLIGEDENGFSTESDAPAAARSRTQVRKKEPAPYKHSASGSGSSSTKKQSPSKEDDKADKHEDSSSAGDTNSSSSDKKKASSPKGASSTERSRTSVDEKHSSVTLTQQQQSDQQQLEGVNGDKSRSGSSPKESKEKTSESSEKQRESSPSNNTSGRNLWVSGLSSTTRATDLKQTFSKYGKVLGAKVVTNARTPGARCYGFVTMAKREDATRCIQHLDRTELHGRMISVEKAKGEATGPGRVKTPTSPAVGKDHKQTEGSKDNHKKESSSFKSNDSDRDQRRESRDKSGKPVRQRITAPSPGPGSERSTSRTAEQPRSEERTAEPFPKKRTHTRSPPPARPPPRRVNHSPGGGLHTRRSTNTTVLTFASIKQARDRQRLREREREDREHARRRDEEARRMERRQREEQIKIEREKEELRMERERIEKARKDILRLEREKAKLERERLEWEREELRRQQQKLREMAERAQAMPTHVAAVVPARSWPSSYSGSSVSPAARYGDVRRSAGSGTKRLSDHHSSDYFDERAAKRPVPSGGDERRSFDSTTTAPPPPRFNSGSSSTNVKRADNRRDIDFSHRSSGSSLFERSSASGAVSGSTSYDRSSGLGRRDAFFANSSTSSSAGRVVEPTRREPDPPRGAKDDRFRESYRPSVRSNERPLSGRDVSGLDSRSGQLTSGSGLSGSSSSSRQARGRYPEAVGRGISSSATSREPWIGGSKNDSSSSSNSWSNRTPVNSTTTDKWLPGTNMSSSNRVFSSALVTGMGMGISSMTTGPPSSNPFVSGDRYDAYKQPLNAIRKY